MSEHGIQYQWSSRSNHVSNEALRSGVLNKIFDEFEAVDERHRISIALTRQNRLCPFAGSDIGRVDVGMCRSTRTDTDG